MNTPKYYIGQKVLFDNDVFTVVEVMYADPVREPGYKIANDEHVLHAVQYELKRPPAKLEFGYCAVGDKIVENNTENYIILDVREKSLLLSHKCSYVIAGEWVTYDQAEHRGWKIKEEEAPKEQLLGWDETKDAYCHVYGYYKGGVCYITRIDESK